MIKNSVFILVFFFLIIKNINASEIDGIINNFQNTKNLSFSFKQNINDKEEEGNCIIEYPKKIYCLYNNNNKKLLVSDGKHLVIKNQRSNQYYIYPIQKTALNLILDKNFLIKKIVNLKEKILDKTYINFEIVENDSEINIFFDNKTFNLVGWQTKDIYQNINVTYLSSIKINQQVDKNLFKLPTQN